MHPTKILIDSKQFIENLQIIQNKIGNNTKLCLPVKANAYGHGLVETSKIAEPNVDYFAVACLDEGVSLVRNGIKKPILVFGAFDDEQIPDLIKYNLEITITSLEKAKKLSDYCCKIETICRVHVKADTGMHRVGALDVDDKDSIYELINYVANNPVLEFIGVYSHLASSDSPNKALTHGQIEKFTKIATYAKSLKSNIICHLANSGGVIYYPESYFDMVRPGIASYGYLTHPETANRLLPVKPCLKLTSRVMHKKTLPANTGVSYGHRYLTKNTEIIATIAIGYGDGFRRSLSNMDQQVLINGKKYPIVGNICMDMLMVSIDSNDSINIGDEVILIDPQNSNPLTIREISEKLGTIDYEVLVGFTSRIPRIFI